MSLTTTERTFVARFASLLPDDAVWVDGGGGIGDWTALVLEHRPGAWVEVFEPLPANAARIRERFAGVAGVVVHEEGLGAQPGRAPLAVDTGDPPLGSSMIRELRGWPHIEVPVVALESLRRIDFLKIDVEGFEPAVIRGLGSHLPAAIQFEYSVNTWIEPPDETVQRLIQSGYMLSPFQYRSAFCNVEAVQQGWARRGW